MYLKIDEFSMPMNEPDFQIHELAWMNIIQSAGLIVEAFEDEGKSITDCARLPSSFQYRMINRYLMKRIDGIGLNIKLIRNNCIFITIGLIAMGFLYGYFYNSVYSVFIFGVGLLLLVALIIKIKSIAKMWDLKYRYRYEAMFLMCTLRSRPWDCEIDIDGMWNWVDGNGSKDNIAVQKFRRMGDLTYTMIACIFVIGNFEAAKVYMNKKNKNIFAS